MGLPWWLLGFLQPPCHVPQPELSKCHGPAHFMPQVALDLRWPERGRRLFRSRVDPELTQLKQSPGGMAVATVVYSSSTPESAQISDSSMASGFTMIALLYIQAEQRLQPAHSMAQHHTRSGAITSQKRMKLWAVSEWSCGIQHRQSIGPP